MSASPAFASTPRCGVGALATGTTTRTGAGNVVSIFAAGGSGSKIEEITIKSTDDPADSTVIFYIHNGTTYYVWDEWDIGNAAAGSTTVASYRETRTYENLILPSGYTLYAQVTVTPTGGTISVLAFGGDY